MNRAVFAIATFAFMLGVRPAKAAGDDKAACFDAADKGQKLREAHRWNEARDQFRLCATAACPATMRADCSSWLAEAEKSIPAAAPSASEVDKAACFDAAEKGQSLRQSHKLVEARDQFRLCVAPSCPATMRDDCSSWLDAADGSIPTIVLVAKDAAGNDVFDVRVSMDGAPLATRLEGAALSVDPGPHAFRFQWADGTSVDKSVLVAEGQKALVVSAAPPAPEPSPVRPVAAPPREAVPDRNGGVRTAGFVVGGVGLGGLAVGAVLGALAFSKVSDAKSECVPAGDCAHNTNPAATSTMQTAGGFGTASTVFFVTGGTLLAAGGLTVFLARPGRQESVSRLAPILLPSGAGIGWNGGFE